MFHVPEVDGKPQNITITQWILFVLMSEDALLIISVNVCYKIESWQKKIFDESFLRYKRLILVFQILDILCIHEGHRHWVDGRHEVFRYLVERQLVRVEGVEKFESWIMDHLDWSHLRPMTERLVEREIRQRLPVFNTDDDFLGWFLAERLVNMTDGKFRIKEVGHVGV